MASQSQMTVGAFLSSAEAALSSRGGLSAIADCDARVVRLLRASPDGTESFISEAPMTGSVAGEDIATQLLDAYAPQADPAELDFARNIYFPITFR